MSNPLESNLAKCKNSKGVNALKTWGIGLLKKRTTFIICGKNHNTVSTVNITFVIQSNIAAMLS